MSGNKRDTVNMNYLINWGCGRDGFGVLNGENVQAEPLVLTKKSKKNMSGSVQDNCRG